MSVVQNRNCLACNAQDLEIVLDLGVQMPVNNLGLDSNGAQPEALAIEACRVCGHGQLTFFVSPVILFEDYLYASSTSSTLQDYQQALAEIVSRIIPDGGSVLEIASNDGLFLKCLLDLGVRCIGIDPAERMVDRANSNGCPTVLGFWPEERRSLDASEFDLVIGQNVLAHTPQPLEFLLAVEETLTESGVAIFQTSQADMLANGELDTIYHEHASYFCEESAKALGDRSGFAHFGVRYSKVHGTSAIFFFAKRKAALLTALSAFDAGSSSWDLWKVSNGLDTASRRSRPMEAWMDFGERGLQRIWDVRQSVKVARETGKRIVAVGAAAKGITFLRAADITVDVLLDEALDKVGTSVDGLGLSIESLFDFAAVSSDFYLFTAWNFSGEMARKLVKHGADMDSESCIYFPSLRHTTLGELAR